LARNRFPIPKGVTVNGAEAVEVQGPKGSCASPARPASLRDAGRPAARLAERDDPALGKFHGLARSLVANAVQGVTEGFKRELDIVGVGYRAEVKGRRCTSRSATRTRSSSTSPPGIDIAVEKQTHVTVTGIDKQLVGQVAANIRRRCASPTPTSRRACATPAKC
jgi:large subunit ribosomal protein L6